MLFCCCCCSRLDSDDIPMRGFIGQLEEGNLLPHTHSTYLYTHYEFNLAYNDNRIIFANISTKEKAPTQLDDVSPPASLTFTYSVSWEETRYTYNYFILYNLSK